MPHSLDCGHPNLSTPTDTTVRVHSQTVSSFPSIWTSPLLVARRAYRNSALRVLLSECKSVLPRIRWILDICAVERRRGKDSIRHWMDGALIPSVYATDYMRYMRQVESLHPFLSIFDSLLLTRTWKAGLEYGIHIGKLQNQEISCDQFSQVPDAELMPAAIAGVTLRLEWTRTKL